MVISNKLISENNLNYRSLVLGNELDKTFTDDMISEMLEKRKRGLEDDSRPQIGEDYDRKVNDVLVNREEEKIIKEYETSERKKENQKKNNNGYAFKRYISKNQ